MMISKSLLPLLLLALQAVLPIALAFQPHAALPRIIQGGMGVRISSWQLAREVSREGELGVISGTAIDTVLVRELQMGKSRVPRTLGLAG